MIAETIAEAENAPLKQTKRSNHIKLLKNKTGSIRPSFFLLLPNHRLAFRFAFRFAFRLAFRLAFRFAFCLAFCFVFCLAFCFAFCLAFCFVSCLAFCFAFCLAFCLAFCFVSCLAFCFAFCLAFCLAFRHAFRLALCFAFRSLSVMRSVLPSVSSSVRFLSCFLFCVPEAIEKVGGELKSFSGLLPSQDSRAPFPLFTPLQATLAAPLVKKSDE